MLNRALTWFLLPFYALRLLVVVLPTLIKAAYPKHPHLLPLVPALIFFMVVVGQFQNHQIDPEQLVNIPQVEATGVPTPAESIATEITIWQDWYQLQPTHRDILLNLALLFLQQGNAEQAQNYLKQVQKIDPNSPLVKQPWK